MAFSPETYALAKKNTKEQIEDAITSVYKYKGSVATIDDLPLEGNLVGDTYDVVSEGGQNYGWNGSQWDSLGVNREATEENLGLIRKKDNTFNNTTFVGDLTAINSEQTSITGEAINETAPNINITGINKITLTGNTEILSNSLILGREDTNTTINGNSFTVVSNSFTVNRDGEIYSGKRLDVTQKIPETDELWIYPDKNYDIILNNPNLNDINFGIYDINKNLIYSSYTSVDEYNFKSTFNANENAYCMKLSNGSTYNGDASVSYKSIMVDYYSAPEVDEKITNIEERADSGEFDGFSPTIETEKIENKTKISITNKTGVSETYISDGVMPVYDEESDYVIFKNAQQLEADGLINAIYGGES